MFEIPGYEILEKLYQSHDFSVYRGIKLNNGHQPIIIKFPSPNIQEANKLHLEFEMLQKINSTYVLKYSELKEDLTYGCILIGSDEQFEALAGFIPERGLELTNFLSIALQLAEGLYEIHQCNIVHNNIDLVNLIIQSDTGKVKYIDFSNAFPLHQIKQITMSPSLPVTRLSYISPEHTGRTDRQLDYRTDFYSLGVVFYQLLCGRLPFDAKGKFQLIHQHIAKQPIAPHEIKSDIPEPLSEIVMKLLNKNAEDRYQSAWGLLVDLKKCLEDLKTQGKINPFILAQKDFPERFYILQKLYGRENELLLLTQALEPLNQRNLDHKPKVILVTGPPGSGKTMLVNEIQSTVMIKKGCFLSGKFDPSNYKVAYSAITQALEMWVKHILLTSDEEKILMWRNQLLAMLGRHGQLLIDVIPNLEWIIGKQSSVFTLDAVQSKNRFHFIFKNFINLLAQPESPLVLFLDDWQRADRASLDLIEELMIDPNVRHLLLIGAYRDNEVEAEHPILRTVNTIQQTGVIVQTIHLQPLTESAIERWMADSIHSSAEIVHPLARLLYQETKGNPFFFRVLLQTLYERQLLKLTQEGWQWNLGGIRQEMHAINNVIEFLESQIRLLPIRTREILELASCLGPHFTLDIVWQAIQTAPEQALHGLQALAYQGLLLQTEESFQFVHDYIQEIVYRLIPLEKRSTLHLAIGRLLQTKLTPESKPELIFEVVNHLNQGSSLISDPVERIELVQRNLTAGKKAKATIAYAAALNYLQAASGYLVGINIWQEHYVLAYELYKELAEVEHLNGHFDESTKYINLLLTYAHTLAEKAEIYSLLITQETRRAHYSEAIHFGYQALNLLGIHLPTDDRLAQLLQAEIETFRENWQDKTIDTILNAPEIPPSNLNAVLKIINHLIPPAFIIHKTLYEFLTIRSVNLSLIHGCSQESIMGYGMYGVLLCTKFNDVALGHQFGLIAIKLSERFQAPIEHCRSHFTYVNFIHPWVKPLRQAQQYIEAGKQSGLEAGELQYLNFLYLYQAYHSFYVGDPLDKVYMELNKCLQFSSTAHNQFINSYARAIRLVVLNLMHHTEGSLLFHDMDKSEQVYQMDWQREKHFNVLTHYRVLKAQALYLHGHFEPALEILNSVKSDLFLIAGNFTVAAHHYYFSLSLTALYPSVDQATQSLYWDQLEANQAQMKIWADRCPENFLHKYLLIAAEMARLQGKEWGADERYDQAIQTAQEQKFIPEHAVACELASRFWMAKGRIRRAKAYLNDAYLSYSQWGAKRKIAQLSRQYPELLKSDIPSSLSHLITNNEMNIAEDNLALIDLVSILKSSATIANEIELPKVLSQMMRVIIENAGAQTGVIWLEEDDQLWLQAEYNLEGHIQILQRLPLERWEKGPRPLIEYVKRTQQTVLLGDASRDPQFSQNLWIKDYDIKSILCMPVIRQQRLRGIIYLENNLLSYAFTERHQQILALLTGRIAISLENALLYESMRLMTERLNLALQMGNIGVWEWNIQENKMRWDESMYAIYGVNRQGFAHTIESFIELVHPADREMAQQAIQQTLTEGVSYHLEHRIIKASDQSIHVVIGQEKVYKNEAGQAVRMIGVTWDITERKQLEEERFEALKRAEEKERQRAEEAEKNRKGQIEFIDTICHEIRNPMSGIYGNVDFLKQTVDILKNLKNTLPTNCLPAIEETLYKFEEIINVIDQCIKHQKVIIDDVLNLSRLESGKETLVFKPFCPKTLIEDTLRIYEMPLAAKHLHWHLSLPEQATAILCDPDRFKIIIMNLISNAIKFTEKGQIKVSLHMQPIESSQISLIFSVEDTGIGMSKEQQTQLFQRFARPMSSQYGTEGSGLGLSITKKIVDLMGGKIQFESEPGRGTRFTVYLTCKSPAPEVLASSSISQAILTPHPQMTTLTSTASQRILIVEDNLVNQKILKRQLEQEGYQCTIANHGQEALEKTRQMNFDLILMDRQMPIMDGLEATKQIRAREKTLDSHPIPIIGLSAYARDELIQEGLAAGMTDYVTKPYEKAKILKVIQESIASSQKPLVPKSEVLLEKKSLVETDTSSLALETKSAGETDTCTLALETKSAGETDTCTLALETKSAAVTDTRTLADEKLFAVPAQMNQQRIIPRHSISHNSLFEEVTHQKILWPERTWMIEPMRRLLYPILDELTAELVSHGIHVLPPIPKFQANSSNSGWQLYTVIGKNEHWATLNLEHEVDVEQLIHALNQSHVQLKAKKMKSGPAHTLVLIFPTQISLKAEIEKIMPSIRTLSMLARRQPPR